MVLSHFKALLGPLGFYQHARGRRPRLEEGYCTDDNARAVQFLVELQNSDTALSSGSIAHDIAHALPLCWQFLVDAQDASGQFRNFRDVHGRWLDERGSEETQARVLRALSSIIQHTPSRLIQQEIAVDMLERLLPHVTTFVFMRSRAEGLIALAALLPRYPAARPALTENLEQLLTGWERSSTPVWPWFEDQLTYANALLPHATLAGARALGILDSTRVQRVLAASTEFLLRTTMADGVFAPVGNAGWFSREGGKAMYDQQPIEAHTMFDFLLALPAAAEAAAAAYLWFWGHNTSGGRLADAQSGACCDGLTADGVNFNCGAESTLAYLRSELLLQQAPAAVTQRVRRQMTHQLLHSAPAAGPT